MNKKKEEVSYYLLTLSFVLICSAIYLYDGYMNGLMGLMPMTAVGIIGTIIFLGIIFKNINKGNVSLLFIRQLAGICVILLLIVTALYPAIINTEMYGYKRWMLILLAILIQLTCLIFIVHFLRYDYRIYFKRKDNVFITLIILLSIVLSYQSKTYYMWDCHNMFSLVDGFNGSLTELFSFSKLAFYNHISYSYVFIAFLHKLIYGTAMLGLIMYSKGLIIISGIGFYKLLRFIYNDANEIECFLGTVLWLVSPFVTGMASYSYNDFATWCVFPYLVYFLYSKKELYAFLTAFYFVFTKESCIITYSFLLLGIYMVEAYKNRKIIHSVGKYFVMLTPCFMWVFSYLKISHWAGGGGLIIDINYFTSKLKSFLCVNFNWAVALIGILGLAVIIFMKQYRSYLEYFLPIAISAFVYILFSGLINTIVNHFRYIDALYTQIYILASFVPFVILKNRIKKIAYYATMGMILMVSCFYTVDPISRLTYTTVDVGTVSVITTGDLLSDSWVYNRQYQNYGYLIDEAISDALNQANPVIYMPAIYNNPWFFDGMGTYSVMEDGAELILNESWNFKKETRMIDTTNVDNNNIEIHIMANNSAIILPENTVGFYIYTDYAGTELAEFINNYYDVIESKTYDKAGWTAKVIYFKSK